MPDPVTPPPGGFNDFHPPPAKTIASIGVYAARIKAGDNPAGAAWRICTIAQPRSVQELIAHVWTARTDVPKDVGLVCADAFADWVDAGKPAVRVPH